MFWRTENYALDAFFIKKLFISKSLLVLAQDRISITNSGSNPKFI